MSHHIDKMLREVEQLSDAQLFYRVFSSPASKSKLSTLKKLLTCDFDNLRLDADFSQNTTLLKKAKMLNEAMKRSLQHALNQKHDWTSSQHVRSYCQFSMQHLKRESLKVFFLNKNSQMISEKSLGTGDLNHVHVYPREVIRECLIAGAHGVVMVHNHPSGDPSPSPADVRMTQRIFAACDVIDVRLVDHLIIGAGKTYSFAQSGLLRACTDQSNTIAGGKNKL
jgi:DNA repair protein RadC